MFIVLLTFSDNKNKASDFMPGHNQWLKKGFNDEVFILAGSLKPNLGGSVIATNTTLSELEKRVNEDPFVAHNIVCVEILEIEPKKTDSRLQFLLD